MITKSLDFTISIKGSVEYKETTVKDLLCYKRTINVNGSKEITQGFCTQKDLKKLITLKALAANTKWEVVDDRFLESVRKWGFAGKEGDFNHFDKYISKKPFDDLNKEGFSLVKIDSFDHSIKDTKEKYLPVAIYFDDIDIRSTNYDLEKVYKILSKNPNIRFVVNDELIPYYNNETGNERYSEFCWSPTVKEYRHIFKYIETHKNSYYQIQNVVLKLDMLGLCKGGASI